jgi:prephenate dehydrogenase
VRVAVLGVGLIGGSIGLAAREHLEGAHVTGFDPSSAVLDAARERGAVDASAGSVAEAVDGAAACFACAPVGALPALVAEALANAPGDCVVTDVGSAKRAVVAATEDERFIGGHPVAGSEAAGVENARADLFQGAAWYLTPGPRSSGVLYDRLHGLLVALGARPVAIDAETHDHLLATVSHVPHVLANVLVGRAAANRDVQLPWVGPSFRDVTRVAGSNPAIWTDIYMANAEAIADELDAMAGELGEVAERLRGGAREEIDAWHLAAREDRRRLLEAELAGGPVHELRVAVPNRPGIVAQLALALGRGGVNIVDMSLAPAPDYRSGAIRFWVAGDSSASRARELVEDLGFPVVEEG